MFEKEVLTGIKAVEKGLQFYMDGKHEWAVKPALGYKLIKFSNQSSMFKFDHQFTSSIISVLPRLQT
jgi:hypothetical protein